MEVVMIIALVLFVAQIVAWCVLPSSGTVKETELELGSIGDESAKKEVMV